MNDYVLIVYNIIYKWFFFLFFIFIDIIIVVNGFYKFNYLILFNNVAS